MPKLQFVDQVGFHDRARAGDGSNIAVLRFAPQAVDTTTQQTGRTIRFVFSDGSVDRMGDTINPAGWQLDDYRANNVALWAHDSSMPPLGRGLNVATVGEKLMGDIEFAEADLSPFADMIFRMYKGGFLNAVSVGFMPIEFALAKDAKRPFGVDFLKQSLMEISCVPIPALPTALVDARAAGIDTSPLIGWVEKMLDGGGMLVVPRVELEALRKAAGVQNTDVEKIPPRKIKSLWHISWLASILSDLDCLEDAVDFEAEMEGDASAVADQLTAALQQLGQALIDMTVEEVSEMLADEDSPGDVPILVTPIETSAMLAAKMIVLRRLGQANAEMLVFVANLLGCKTHPSHVGEIGTKAGRVLSSTNETALRDAHGMITNARDTIQAVLDSTAPSDGEQVNNAAKAKRKRVAQALKLAS